MLAFGKHLPKLCEIDPKRFACSTPQSQGHQRDGLLLSGLWINSRPKVSILSSILAERVPNEKIRALMATVDIIADQLIIGWYAMFALEGMAMEKPVLCYLRDDLEKLYEATGLIQIDELPIVG